MAGKNWFGMDPGVKLGLDLGTKVARTLTGTIHRRQMAKIGQKEADQQNEVLRAPPKVHGSAAWATAGELSEVGLLSGASRFDHPSSLLLGAASGPAGTGSPPSWVHWDGEGHLLTVAPTRSGKSTTTIVPNLLRYRGSCVVLDPKGELYRDTSAWRAANVGPVYRIAPFEADTHAFNPLSIVREPSDARALADLMIPDDPKAQDFFKKDAVSFLTALILFVNAKAPPQRRNLQEIRRLTTLPTEDFLAAARTMSGSGVPAIANAANIVLGKSKDRGLPNLRDTLNTELSLWDDPGVIRATGRADLDFRDLKDRPATVYISVPFDKTKAFAPFIKVLLTTALEAMIQNPRIPDIPVLFVLDEFLSLGPFEHFRDAIRTHAGAGVRLWFFLQNLSTLEEHYPASWKAFLDAAVKVFFGTGDTFTGKLVSEFLGDTTIAYRSSSIAHQFSTSVGDMFDLSANRSLNVTHNVNLTGRALLQPAEVVRLLSGTRPDQTREAIAFFGGVNPVQLRLVPYYLGTLCPPRVGQVGR